MLYQCLLIRLAMETSLKDWLHDEYWVMYGRVESLYYTPETNVTLCVNYSGIKIF